jgi:hypothetical protein
MSFTHLAFWKYLGARIMSGTGALQYFCAVPQSRRK